MSNFITVKKLTQEFPFSKSQIYRMISAGSIPNYKVNGKYLFDRDEISNWIKGNKSGAKIFELIENWY